MLVRKVKEKEDMNKKTAYEKKIMIWQVNMCDCSNNIYIYIYLNVHLLIMFNSQTDLPFRVPKLLTIREKFGIIRVSLRLRLFSSGSNTG